LAWTPSVSRSVELTLFHNSVNDHRAEDPYGGLSLPSDRKIYGIELAARTELADTVGLHGNLSLIGGNNGSEEYQVQKFCFVRPDGSTVCEYDQWDEPIDQGPGWLANLGLRWKIGSGHNLDVGLSAAGRFDYSYKKGEREGDYSQPLLVNLCYRRPGFLKGLDSLTLRVTNLFGSDYHQPDLYGPVKGAPLQASLLWQLGF
jgi:outer membrane receptor protein involved in Fe transport